MFREFIPKSYLSLRSGYSWNSFRKDLAAGMTVGVIALPLAMAFAISSGTTPDRGLFTAIIAGFLISALGGSRAQIGGPTGAFVVIVYDIMQRTGYEGLAISTMIAAALLICLGALKLGSWIKYVPHPLVVGFTAGIALMIFSSQIKDFLGLRMGAVPAGFIDKWAAYATALPSVHFPTCWVGLGTLGFILILRRWKPRIPWGIAAIAAATLACYLFDVPVDTVKTRFGHIPHQLPWPALPSFQIVEGRLSEIIADAAAIAFLGAIESLLSAVIADGMMGTRHQSNGELVAQGIANFGSILFGGIPATGAIARTAANVKNGAQTPVAGMVHAAALWAIIVVLAPLVSQIPLASLAAVLIVVAWNMSEMNRFVQLLKAGHGDVVILVTAFLLTVFVDITAAVCLGMIVASLFFMKRMSDHSQTVSLTRLLKEPPSDVPEHFDPIATQKIPPGVEVYELQGPFFFGAADMLHDLLRNLEKPPKVFVLRMRHVPMIDASGMHALQQFYENCKKCGAVLLLSGIQDRTRKDLEQFGLADLIGPSHIFSRLDRALSKSTELIKNSSS